MTDRKCRTCRHWTSPNNMTPWEREFGSFGRYSHPDEEKQLKDDCHRVCFGILHVCEASGIEPIPVAYTSDASGYMADLWTAPEFGCALWEQGQ